MSILFLYQAILLANVFKWNGIKYNGKPYPDWAEAVGWLLCLIPIVIVVGSVIYVFAKTPGTLKQVK